MGDAKKKFEDWGGHGGTYLNREKYLTDVKGAYDQTFSGKGGLADLEAPDSQEIGTEGNKENNQKYAVEQSRLAGEKAVNDKFASDQKTAADITQSDLNSSMMAATQKADMKKRGRNKLYENRVGAWGGL